MGKKFSEEYDMLCISGSNARMNAFSSLYCLFRFLWKKEYLSRMIILVWIPKIEHFFKFDPSEHPFYPIWKSSSPSIVIDFFWPIEIWEVGGKVVIKEVKLVALANSKEIILPNQVYLFTFYKDITNPQDEITYKKPFLWTYFKMNIVTTSSVCYRHSIFIIYSIWQCNFLNTGIHHIYKHVLHRSLNILHETVNDMLHIIL